MESHGLLRKKRGDYKTLEEYFKFKTGKDDPDLLLPEYRIRNMDKAAMMIKSAVTAGMHICVVGDYDADGLDGLTEMMLIMMRLKADYSIIIPRRISEGYGISMKTLDRIHRENNVFVITVDNGISGHEVFKEIRRRGWKSLIIDHHTYDGKAPDADLVIDPEFDNTGCDYDGYCAAGLVYKLACEMFPDDERFLKTIAAFAAIGTVADIVPLLEDNRRIVKTGLEAINSMSATAGLNNIKKKLFPDNPVSSKDIAFGLGPCINTPGRLHDNGGEDVIRAFLLNENSDLVKKMVELNDKRKELTKNAIETIKPEGNKINFIYNEDIPEGICGIIAGKLMESNGKPTFVVTKSKGTGIIKGSCRCNEDNHVYDMLKKCSDGLLGFGGHKCAAGFQIKEECLKNVINGLDGCANPVNMEEYYDLEVTPEKMLDTYLKLQKYEPFGYKMENPVVMIKGIPNDIRFIGKDKTTVSMTVGSMKVIGFHMSEKFRSLVDITEQSGKNPSVTFYGEFEPNYYRGNEIPQFRISDIAF